MATSTKAETTRQTTQKKLMARGTSRLSPDGIEWLNAMTTVLASHGVEEVPAGWYSRAQLAKLLKLSERAIAAQLPKMIKAGAVERKDFRIRLEAGGIIRHTAHYRVIPKKK